MTHFLWGVSGSAKWVNWGKIDPISNLLKDLYQPFILKTLTNEFEAKTDTYISHLINFQFIPHSFGGSRGPQSGSIWGKISISRVM